MLVYLLLALMELATFLALDPVATLPPPPKGHALKDYALACLVNAFTLIDLLINKPVYVLNMQRNGFLVTADTPRRQLYRVLKR